jgi:hypothetical protein
MQSGVRLRFHREQNDAFRNGMLGVSVADGFRGSLPFFGEIRGLGDQYANGDSLERHENDVRNK